MEQEGVGGYVIGGVIVVLAIVGWNWFKEYNNKPKYFNSDKISSYTSAKRKGWELWVFSTDKPNTDYQIFDQLGLSSKSQCVSEGMARTRNSGSYQCGYNCYTSSSKVEDFEPNTVEICELICDRSGCR
ncbi:MAG: hypothetical protein WCW47_03840 [Candidatus Paceibacterota bacterium]